MSPRRPLALAAILAAASPASAVEDDPLATLGSMLGPSPDGFVGTHGFTPRDANGWIDDVTGDLLPYDGGTRDANVWELFGPLTMPPEPFSRITAASGQLVGPDSLGTFRFHRISGRGIPALGTIRRQLLAERRSVAAR